MAADAEEVIEYAKYLGIDPLKEPHLLRIAQVRQQELHICHKVPPKVPPISHKLWSPL